MTRRHDLKHNFLIESDGGRIGTKSRFNSWTLADKIKESQSTNSTHTRYPTRLVIQTEPIYSVTEWDKRFFSHYNMFRFKHFRDFVGFVFSVSS